MRNVVIIVLLSVLFVLATAGYLPGTVASHFSLTGTANGFMAGPRYTALMIAVVTLVPLLCAWLGRWVKTLPDDLINLPHKAYWLAPERKAQTLGYLANWLQWCGIGVAVFLCYLHWVVVQGNMQTPSQLNPLALYVGLAVALSAQTFGVMALVLRFRRVDS